MQAARTARAPSSASSLPERFRGPPRLRRSRRGRSPSSRAPRGRRRQPLRSRAAAALTPSGAIFRFTLPAAPLFCLPNSFVRRDQMAVFLLKTTHGAAFDPPDCAGSSTTSPARPLRRLDRGARRRGHHGRLRRRQLLPAHPGHARADGGLPAQGRARRRVHAAGLHGRFSPTCRAPSPFAAWIEQLAAEGITGGCGGGNYCPARPSPGRRWPSSC